MPLGCRHKDLHFIRFYGLWDPDNCEHEILRTPEPESLELQLAAAQAAQAVKAVKVWRLELELELMIPHLRSLLPHNR